ncbi:hypothetical protein BSKO_10716 [Bryopsis sp. KO-2023]|nr:hypothetical protein BSKO_10716 [Bryopsis sp. KO-2023]
MAEGLRFIKLNSKRLREEKQREEEQIRLRNEKKAKKMGGETVNDSSRNPDPTLLDPTFTDFEPPWMQLLFHPDVDARNEILSPLTALIRETPFGDDVLDESDDVGEYDPVESLLEGPIFCDLIGELGVGWVNREFVDALVDVLIQSNKTCVIHGSYRGLQALFAQGYQPWMPDIESFNKYFKKCGYTYEGTKLDWEEMEDLTSHKKRMSTEFTNIKVRLMLSLTTAVIKSGPERFIPRSWGKSTMKLVCMIAHFMLDLSAEAYRVEASRALEAVLGCMGERKLAKLTEKILEGLVNLGPSHRSQLKLLEMTLEVTPEAKTLKRLWAMASLRRILPKEVPFDPSLTEAPPTTCLTHLIELMNNPTTLIKHFEKDYESSGGGVVPMDWWLGDSVLGILDKLIHLCIKQDDIPVSEELSDKATEVWSNFRYQWTEYSRIKGSMKSVGSVQIQCRLKLLRLAWESSWEEEEDDFWGC